MSKRVMCKYKTPRGDLFSLTFQGNSSRLGSSFYPTNNGFNEANFYNKPRGLWTWGLNLPRWGGIILTVSWESVITPVLVRQRLAQGVLWPLILRYSWLVGSGGPWSLWCLMAECSSLSDHSTPPSSPWKHHPTLITTDRHRWHFYSRSFDPRGTIK